MNEKDIDYGKIVGILKPFAAKNTAIANFQFISTFLILWGLILTSYYFVGRNNYVLIVTTPLISAFMCRSYVIVHDCGHLSFYPKKAANVIVGTIMGFGIWIPYAMWKFIHDSHHSNVGNLDKRELNPEVWTMTVEEYKRSSTVKKVIYRFMRSRLNRMVIVPAINFGIIFRLVHPKFNRTAIVSTIVHDLLYGVLVWFLLSFMPLHQLFFVFFLPLILFFCVAAFTLYAQHQFEDTYWENNEDWSVDEANFKGSTCIKAPDWYRWLVGDVLFHNVHHMLPGIPNYNMRKAEEELSSQIEYKYIYVTEVWDMLGLKLWDEKTKKLVAFNKVS